MLISTVCCPELPFLTVFRICQDEMCKWKSDSSRISPFFGPAFGAMSLLRSQSLASRLDARETVLEVPGVARASREWTKVLQFRTTLAGNQIRSCEVSSPTSH